MAPRRYQLQRRGEAVEETRARIVRATFELHNERGVLATSMQDIAERADVALRTVYNHFPTREDIVGACGVTVRELLAAPSPAIFEGLPGVDERVRALVDAAFAMYERGARMISVARCEQHAVRRLAEFVAADDRAHEVLVRAALRPIRARESTVREVAALTDFYVWKACTEKGLSTRQAADLAYRSVLATLPTSGNTTAPGSVGDHRRR